MNIGMILLIIVGGCAGALSTLYIVVSLVGMITYKLYRTARYRISLYN